MEKKRLLISAVSIAALALAGIACSDDSDDSTSNNSQTTPPTTPKALSLDTAFGTGGIATVPLSASANDRFMAVTSAPDGKTYAAGFVTEGADQLMAVARIDATGKLDTTFGTGGIASVNVAAGGRTAELARAVQVQSSGKIIIGGPAEHDPLASGDAGRDTDAAVARFDTTGKLDTTFGTGGIARIDFSTGKITTGTTFVGDTSWGMATLPGDKIAIFGSKLADGADRVDSDYVMAGLTAAGALDTAFGTGGKVIVDQSETSDSPRNMLFHDNKIVATGYSAMEGGVVQPVLIRVDLAGKLDATFGTNGVATAKVLAGVTESYNVALQGTNYILAGYGRGADTAEKVDLVVYRFTDKGVHDTTFGTAGVARVDIAKEDDRARNVMVLPDGRILATGSGKKDAVNVDAMMVLVSKDGVIESGFGEAGHLISDLGGPADAWYGVTVSADKKYVIIAGYKGVDATSGGNDDAIIARIAL